MPAVSAAETVTLNITGSGSVVFPSPSATTSFADFSVSGNSCQGTLIAPTTCQVAIVFTDSSAPSTILETATLTISYSIAGSPVSLTVPLSGAYGAIKLFDATTTQISVASASFTNLYTIASVGLNLSCPSNPTAILSSSPDGSGYVLTDNYILLSLDGAPVYTSLSANGQSAEYSNSGTQAYPPGNICQGSDASPDSFNGNTYPECFSATYRTDVSRLLGLSGDLIVNPGNAYLDNAAAAGVPPLNLQSLFGPAEGENPPPFSLPVTVSLVDAGGDSASSSVFLITTCTISGVTPGGTITGNPITPNNTSSQTQTFTFDSVPSQNISLTTSDAVAIQQGTSTATGIVPIVTDIGISQLAFSNLIRGTSAAPAVCFRLSGEVDQYGNKLCKGFLIQCYDPNLGTPEFGTTTGTNCDTQAAGAALVRNLYDSAQFSSPDGPVGANYLYNLTGDACTFFVSVQQNAGNGTCAQPSSPGLNPSTLIGPGFLLGGDAWLNQDSNGNYDPANCTLTGVLDGDLCPLDTLTAFYGAADPQPGGGTQGRNSVYVPVVNMPLPFTTASIAKNANGWVNSASSTANFTSNAATYPAPSSNPIPSANSFTPASPYSLTYGIAGAADSQGNPIPVPGTTYPVPGDTTAYNTGVNENLQSPLCGSGIATSFITPVSLPSQSGIYNLHYFTTDCALTEELWFNPQGSGLTDPTANWASFPVVSFGIDSTAPSLVCTVPPAAYNGWYAGNVTVNCNATDDLSGFAPGKAVPNTGTSLLNGLLQGQGAVLQGSLSQAFAVTTTFAGGTNPAVPLTAQISDLAGNTASQAFSFAIDTQAPAITGPTLSPSGPNFVAGQPAVTISYSCSDGLGSGVASCSLVGALPSGTIGPACTTSAAGVSCSATFTPSASNVGNYSVKVTSADNVGNASASAVVPFSISYAPASVLFGGVGFAVPGAPLVYLVGAVDTNPATNPVSIYGASISTQLQMPSSWLAPGGGASAIYADVTCSSFPCTATPAGGASCSVTTSTANGTTTVSVNCNVGTVLDLNKYKTGVVVKITVPISSKAPAGKSITASGVITAASPISGTTSFRSSIPII